ncbi:hypothetical protein COY26_05435 [Candidatus Woesearchaeota archaeon CG_4_10_14_0_2_um_filter_33_10]|nr:MAG: hypothetical protein AUJ83_02110 [Candidatus Woesearchaeota archaeon CG1_02_33_12]PIN78694.1 MAG: hypothetical protein COV14_02655 [Candidatus Woesearchaeota archaeon CG10_big_fil_rev_8_21_14_0_10_33_12]PIU72175.1 MAG: hypothetical protein COS79_04345 [Candidatus Woesearchaeota archaeon CG06_land_8_20_14_3_00_33_13]PIZ51844.1 MAG: hypothetical protein COY26_05435 [Candidatus Woesearchaeota archaeon CG_4_10_14_0_2_um_filter_33_10]
MNFCNVFNGKKSIRIVLSDAGDILFDSASSINRQKEILTELFNRNGMNYSIDDVCNMFKPYKILSQTKVSMKEAINLFLNDNFINASYADYCKLINKNYNSNKKIKLFKDVTKTLEILNCKGILFYILTDATEKRNNLYSKIEKMIVSQLVERGVYKAYNFNVLNYISGIISSKDIGVKKPNPKFFNIALKCGKGYFKKSEAVFIAHESNEIFGAANLGIDVIALNYWKEKNSVEISKKISEHNIKYKSNKLNSRIYQVKHFSDISKVV